MQSNSILSVNHATIQLIVTKKTLKVSRSETMYIYSLNFISFVCLLFFVLLTFVELYSFLLFFVLLTSLNCIHFLPFFLHELYS